jgi:hypothetical protein
MVSAEFVNMIKSVAPPPPRGAPSLIESRKERFARKTLRREFAAGTERASRKGHGGASRTRAPGVMGRTARVDGTGTFYARSFTGSLSQLLAQGAGLYAREAETEGDDRFGRLRRRVAQSLASALSSVARGLATVVESIRAILGSPASPHAVLYPTTLALTYLSSCSICTRHLRPTT